MTVMISKHKFFFASAPKVACTSIKTEMFRVENGFDFRPFHANGHYRHIHDNAIYPAAPFERFSHLDFSGYLKLTMVRDPVRRFLSAYSNRVGYYRELSAEALGDDHLGNGIIPNPSIHEFIDGLSKYRNASGSIRLHTEPLKVFLGSDPSFYDQIFNIRKIDQFDKVVSDWIGDSFSTPHLQTGGEKIGVSELSVSELKKIRKFYEDDYELFGEYFE
ncbi:sulfotransferase family 2 domain-containing protein (plasmid) [Tritonibacter scottomollicae]|uniref:Sulfotransferase family 2 domain-containing protein n=1 Tax=Tritonibacter scottomollicae TaxID=483013 RepID=A0ABZ0HLJ2_TRISK|nr:sulfotransferase family 2 domain-containing protein [Tritonibacter scottomollicae]WOI35321.1 sulfotransferase family 2 domain-containing protein [Tritonibacter scottomollicae]